MSNALRISNQSSKGSAMAAMAANSQRVFAQLKSDAEVGQVWWAERLQEITDEMGLVIPSQHRPLRVISCCSGSCAEAAVLQVGRLGSSIESGKESTILL